MNLKIITVTIFLILTSAVNANTNAKEIFEQLKQKSQSIEAIQNNIKNLCDLCDTSLESISYSEGEKYAYFMMDDRGDIGIACKVEVSMLKKFENGIHRNIICRDPKSGGMIKYSVNTEVTLNKSVLLMTRANTNTTGAILNRKSQCLRINPGI